MPLISFKMSVFNNSSKIHAENYFEKPYTDGFFNVSGENGFLPTKEPLKELPIRYEELQQLIDDLPITKNNGEKGILSIPDEIVRRVELLPNYEDIVANEDDVYVLQALFRAYTFVTSAYTLEPSFLEYLQTGNYGEARRLLPKNVSKPLVIVSSKLQVYPFLDYHYAYSLGNYVKKDNDGTLDWQNLDMACKFSGTTDEIGFIMLHVYINELSPKLINSIMNYGKNININNCLKECSEVMESMNLRRKEMWKASRHERYNDFRVFIMGIKGNTHLYGDGLVYEDCFNNEPQQYRGQTGAQDSIIPTVDIFTGIVDYYPENKLTEYLMDLRTYRPKCIQEFFIDLRDYYQNNNIFKTLSNNKNYEGLIYLLKIVDEVYLFRNGHWQFVQKYIMANTKYEFATGGTPITSWLINQIEAVLQYEKIILSYLNDNIDLTIFENYLIYKDINEAYERKEKLLIEQVNILNERNYNVDLVYIKNVELNLEDKN